MFEIDSTHHALHAKVHSLHLSDVAVLIVEALTWGFCEAWLPSSFTDCRFLTSVSDVESTACYSGMGTAQGTHSGTAPSCITASER